MTRPVPFALGVLSLALVWGFPLPVIDAPPFSKHMVKHMSVVALAAPLLSLGLSGGAWDPVRRWPGRVSAVVASMVELVLVWSWHSPALHHAARHHPWALVAEQGTFLVAGLYLWGAALGGTRAQRKQRSVAGVIGLLLTSMHMTLLGALIALTPRVLYPHHATSAGLSPLMEER